MSALRINFRVAAVVTSLLCSSAIAGPYDISTVPPSPGFSALSWGADNGDNYPAVGQTFRTPNVTGLYMTSTTFYLGNANPPAGLNLDPVTQEYKFYVAPWDSVAKLPGTPIFTSSTFVAPTVAGNGFVPVNFNTGILSLSPSSNYIAYVSVLGLTPNANNALSFGATLQDPPSYSPYPDGGLAWYDPVNLPTPTGWGEGSDDAAFAMAISN